MVNRKNVAVIGGGVSGLAAAKAFDTRGHRVTGFERSHDFGGVWEPSRSYPGVQTQSPKDLYCYTDLPMPESYPEWPKGPQVHAYLHSYAAKHNLARLFRLNTNILSMDRRADGKPGWSLTIEEAGRERVEDFDFVAICSGQFSEKNIITHPGQEDFVAQGGQVMHSSEYTDPEIAWMGKTEEECKAEGIEVKKGAFPWAASGRSLSIGRNEGLTKVLFDKKSGQLIGAGIVGTNAGELIAEAVLALEMGADAEDIGLTIHPHPTLSETLNFAAEVAEGTCTDIYMPKK